jgi:two-component sensor histidine kinase
VTLSCSVEQVELDANQAVSVGLIVNELLQNSLKHAFPGNTAGEVAVRLARVANDLVLEVADTGAGAREVRENGTGQRLVRALAQQLGGSAKWDGPPGTRVTVRFPAPRREQGAARPNLTVVPSTVAH